VLRAFVFVECEIVGEKKRGKAEQNKKNKGSKKTLDKNVIMNEHASGRSNELYRTNKLCSLVKVKAEEK
jgi:hypothetical protein